MSLEKFYIIIIEAQWSLSMVCGCNLLNFSVFFKNLGYKSPQHEKLSLYNHKRIILNSFVSILIAYLRDEKLQEIFLKLLISFNNSYW